MLPAVVCSIQLVGKKKKMKNKIKSQKILHLEYCRFTDVKGTGSRCADGTINRGSGFCSSNYVCDC